MAGRYDLHPTYSELRVANLEGAGAPKRRILLVLASGPSLLESQGPAGLLQRPAARIPTLPPTPQDLTLTAALPTLVRPSLPQPETPTSPPIPKTSLLSFVAALPPLSKSCLLQPFPSNEPAPRLSPPPNVPSPGLPNLRTSPRKPPLA
jgi:hypothetical protein